MMQPRIMKGLVCFVKRIRRPVRRPPRLRATRRALLEEIVC
jgi:hypothetical protein